MIGNKKLVFLLFLPVLIIILSNNIESDCCTNPNTDNLRYCSSDASLEECCPEPSSPNAYSYYYSSSRPYGPKSYQECTAGFFIDGSICPEDDCTEVCCCDAVYPNNYGDPENEQIMFGICKAIGGTARTGIDCKIECNITTPQPSDDCSKDSYIPIIRLIHNLEEDRGKKTATLEWSDPCAGIISSYKISRKTGAGAYQLLSQTSENFYKDESSELLWKTTYKYKVEATYTNSKKASAEIEITLGDLECWYRYDGSKFCVHIGTYAMYKDYLIKTNPSIRENTFNDNIMSIYGKTGKNTLNQGYSCNADNTLYKHESCPDDKVCIISSDSQGRQNVECKEKSNCEPTDYQNSPFGLYSTREECNSLGYCYFDTSTTLVDKCYSCDYFMSCYDYKSEQACVDDNCNFANCHWKPIIHGFGVGVCIKTDKNNCDWCDKAGTDDMDASSYNSVYASCTAEKAEALSTEIYPCYYSDGKAKSCDTISCIDFDPVSEPNKCPVSPPLFNIDNTPDYQPEDKCDIGVCQNFGGKCRKNADYNDNKPSTQTQDCAEGDLLCEQDVYAPETELTKILDDGFLVGLSINIEDITGAHEKVNNPFGYKTLFCIDGPSSNTCLNKLGRDYGLSTNDTKIHINGLHLNEWNTDRNITYLSEGVNTIYYYSQDPAKNLGQVKSIQVEAHKNNTRPEIYNIEIEPGFNIDNILYTNSPKPGFKLYFREGGANLTGASLRDGSNIDVISFNQFQISPTPNFGKILYTLTPPSATNLSEGAYTLSLTANNEYNHPLPLSQSLITVNVDYTISQAVITPPPPSFTNNSQITLTIDFQRDVRLISVIITDPYDINKEELVAQFPDDYRQSFSKVLNLTDGTKIVKVFGKDKFGNDAAGSSEFVINAQPKPVLKIINPSYGVSNVNMFNITIYSDNEVNCRYSRVDPSLYGSIPASDIFSRMTAFNPTGSILHVIKDFQLTDENPHKLYVWCKDTYWREEPFKYEFNIKVDKSPPVINLFTFPPSPIAELPVNLSIVAESSEPIVCRYSTTQKRYSAMTDEFGAGFDETGKESYKQLIYRYFTQKGDHTYYIACKNQAELISAPKQITFRIDPELPFRITDRTELYQGTTSPTIAIETNKVALCWYSEVKDGLVYPLNPRADSFVHTATLYDVNLSSSSYKVYVSCTSTQKSETANIEVMFNIDLTPPAMQYVNDTSTIYGKPEFTAYPNKLFVEWLAVDNETGFINSKGKIRYNLSLMESSSRDVIINWTDNYDEDDLDDNKFSGWIKEDHNGNNLNLSDGTKYFFKVKAVNIVGHWSQELESDGVTTDFSLQPNMTCQEAGECSIGEPCVNNNNCLSGYCDEDSICAEPECDDNVKNGDETDKDCGGDDCGPCEKGDSCKVNSDCESGLQCKYGECRDMDSCSDGSMSSGETDIDCGGVCPRRCMEGQYCDADTDCESGLLCRSGTCKSASSQPEKDTDNDGMPDAWEIRYSLDPDDPADADLDFDGDGLTNYQEYIYNTDPNNADTDGDGYSDKKEVDKGTDPTDPNSKPGSFLKIFLIVLLILIVLAAIAYLVYTQYFQKKKPSQPIRQFMPQMQSRQPFFRILQKRPLPYALRKLKEDKLQKRSSLFDKFKTEEEKKGEKEQAKAQAKEEEKPAEKKEYIDLSELPSKKEKPKLKQPEEGVFRKLSSLIEKDKKEKSEANREKNIDESALNKLSALSKKASADIKKDLKNHSKKIGSKLSEIEKKVGVISKPVLVYATSTGAKYHFANCIVIKDMPKSKLIRFKDASEAVRKKLTPCSVCHPKK